MALPLFVAANLIIGSILAGTIALLVKGKLLPRGATPAVPASDRFPPPQDTLQDVYAIRTAPQCLPFTRIGASTSFRRMSRPSPMSRL